MSRLTADPIEACRQLLLQQAAVTAITGTRVRTTLQGPDPAIRVAAAGGDVGTNPGQSLPRLQVECWGAGQASTGPAVDDGTAGFLARTVLASLPVQGVTVPAGHITSAWVEGLPFESPDPQTGRPRWIVTVRLDLFPT